MQGYAQASNTLSRSSDVRFLLSRVAESTAGSSGDVIDVEGFSGPLVKVAVVNWLTTFTSSAYAVVRVVEEVSDSVASAHCAD